MKISLREDRPWAPNFVSAFMCLLDLFFPRDCVVSGLPVDNTPWRYLAPEGLAQLYRVSGYCCQSCGNPFWGKLAGPQVCPHCHSLKPVFSNGKVAVLAKGAGRTLVHTLKYHQGTWVAQDVARIIATTPGFPAFLEGAVIVPVPLHARRLRRGYNQAQLIAEHLVRLLPERRLRIELLLERIRDTPTQTRLDREGRAKNMKGAFALRPDIEVDKAARHIVFDDVFTTGATLNSCSKVLARAGITRLDIAAFAHG